MKTKNLAKNIGKPLSIKFCEIESINIDSYLQPNTIKDILFHYKITLKSKSNNLNNVNLLDIILWLETFDYIKIIDWDDDKEYDFNDINKISILLKFNFKKYFKEKSKMPDYEIENNLFELFKSNKAELNNFAVDSFKNYLNENSIF